jgi:hypothetical protein
MATPRWVKKVRKVETESKLIVLAFSKQDAEEYLGAKLTPAQWAKIRKRFEKEYPTGDTLQYIADIADEVKNGGPLPPCR